MNDEIKEDVLEILRKVIEILETREEKDVLEIGEISNHTLHSASIFQDEDAISVAVVIYAIYKIIERHADVELQIYPLILSYLKRAKYLLKRNEVEKYRLTVSNLLKEIAKIDDKLKIYIMDVIEKAKITKGSKIYEHGVSMEKTAEMLGISQWELMSYVGKMEISEEIPQITSLKQRLIYTRRLFGI